MVNRCVLFNNGCLLISLVSEVANITGFVKVADAMLDQGLV